eukprot:1021528-Prorocentrum_minimum.AAC.1
MHRKIVSTYEPKECSLIHLTTPTESPESGGNNTTTAPRTPRRTSTKKRTTGKGKTDKRPTLPNLQQDLSDLFEPTAGSTTDAIIAYRQRARKEWLTSGHLSSPSEAFHDSDAVRGVSMLLSHERAT